MPATQAGTAASSTAVSRAGVSYPATVIIGNIVVRALIAYIVCIVLALLSVSGAHVHAHGHHDPEAVHGIDHGTAHASDRDTADDAHHDAADRDTAADHEAADETDHATADIDTDHLSDHEHHHAVDIDRDAKAFGKHSISPPVLLLALWCRIFSIDLEPRGTVIFRAPPLRPPQPRSRFFVFPPSHAPPSLLA